VSEALGRYVEQYPAFETTRECKFLHQLVAAFTSTEADALDKFTTAIQKWNAITALVCLCGTSYITITYIHTCAYLFALTSLCSIVMYVCIQLTG
jgi:hypothetical protein